MTIPHIFFDSGALANHMTDISTVEISWTSLRMRRHQVELLLLSLDCCEKGRDSGRDCFREGLKHGLQLFRLDSRSAWRSGAWAPGRKR